MDQEMAREGCMGEYLGHSAGLIGDKRTGETFGEVVRGTCDGYLTHPPQSEGCSGLC